MRRLAAPLVAAALAAACARDRESRAHSPAPLPARALLVRPVPLSSRPARSPRQTQQLEDGDFDVLVVGGGATGCGIALDAATRGLRVALVEREDFASGTSSRSTKLVHGGVRYLEKAVLELDWAQFSLVREALRERATFLRNAPHTASQLDIVLPAYSYLELVYYWAGAKAYDFLARVAGCALSPSYGLSTAGALEAFPMLRSEGLRGAVVYSDGQHNDARTNVLLATSALRRGAICVNYAEVVGLVRRDGRVVGATVVDRETGREFDVRARGVINACGPFADSLRQLEGKYGLLDAHTSDGRVLFLLPWEGRVLAGTTEASVALTQTPMPTEAEITWVLDELRRHLRPDVSLSRDDILASWSGFRPLVRDPKALDKGSEALVRSHLVERTADGLLTIVGGKWTTYRQMAEEAVDEAIRAFGLPHAPCITEHTPLEGGDGYSDALPTALAAYVDEDVAAHLAHAYGTHATALVREAPVRLSSDLPYVEAEVLWAVRHECARTVTDVLARRTRLAFVDARAAWRASERVARLMARELGWNEARVQHEIRSTRAFLHTMGLGDDDRRCGHGSGAKPRLARVPSAALHTPTSSSSGQSQRASSASVVDYVLSVPAPDLLTLAPHPHYRARVHVSASKNLVKPGTWLDTDGKVPAHAYAAVRFGHGTYVLEQEVNSYADDEPALLSPRANVWDLAFFMCAAIASPRAEPFSSSPQIVDPLRLQENPDLAYNVPLSIRIFCRHKSSKEPDSLLAELHRWIDISTPAGTNQFVRVQVSSA